MAFPFFISMLDPFWTITTDFDADLLLATRLRCPPNEDADEVVVQASTEQRAMAAAKITKREEEVYILIVYKGLLLIEIGVCLFQLCYVKLARVAVVEMRAK